MLNRRQSRPPSSMRPQYPLLAVVGATEAVLPGDASYIVPYAFPTSVYSSYYGKTIQLLHPARDQTIQVLTVRKFNRGQHRSLSRPYTILF